MKAQAWDVLLVKPSRMADEPRIKVHLPYTVVTGVLIQTYGDTDYYHIDTVFVDNDIDRDSVLRSLIDHDGYPSNIVVRRA